MKRLVIAGAAGCVVAAAAMYFFVLPMLHGGSGKVGGAPAAVAATMAHTRIQFETTTERAHKHVDAARLVDRVDRDAPFGLVAPPGTPEPVVAKLADSMKVALTDPGLREAAVARLHLVDDGLQRAHDLLHVHDDAREGEVRDGLEGGHLDPLGVDQHEA